MTNRPSTVPLTTPHPNINGTNARSLVDERLDAMEALQTAMDKLRAMTVHGRDWQTVDPSVYRAARAEHVLRIDRVQTIRDEITQEVIWLMEWIDTYKQ